MTHSACAVLVAAALSASLAVPAYGQSTTDPAQTTPTQTTPTETTPAPTPPESPEGTSSPSEYVESVPTGGGQAPAANVPESVAPAPAPAPAPTSPAAPSGATRRNKPDAAKPKRVHHKKETRSPERRQRHAAPATPEAAPPLPGTPAAATAGEPANPLLLGLALLGITVAVVGTAVSRRHGAGA